MGKQGSAADTPVGPKEPRYSVLSIAKKQRNYARHAGGPPDIIFQCIDLSRPLSKAVGGGVCMAEDKFVPLSGTFKELNIQFVLG